MLTQPAMTRHITKFFYGALAAVLLLVTIALLPLVPSKASAQLTERVPASQGEITLTFAPLVRETSPAVVNIYTKTVVSTPARSAREAFFRQFNGIPDERVSSSLGSGVIVGSDGVVVTNNHVIDGATELTVVLSDRRQYTAQLVLADERTDLAVLRIETGEEALPTLEFADTRDLAVGDLVLAIGNPFGVGQTVTSGIISATARTDVGVSDYAFFLQTDAAVNPGNSGGALINTQGELVGVNTAIFSRSGGSNGIGFAIPAEMVRRVVDAAINEGMIVRPWLGLKGESVTFDMAQSQGLDRPVGVIVTEVYDEGPADAAGLRRGDLIVSIDDREVFDERGLKFLAALKSPGERAQLEIIRGGDRRTVYASLAPPPGATEAERILLQGAHPFSGAEVAELSPRLAEELGRDPFETGILVTRVLRNAYARRVVRPGDVILTVNGQDVDDLDALEAQLGLPRTQWAIEVDRNGRRIRGTVRL
ncbi:MAG: Do family serine endopeptidase [Pseudomonadota bacterium]